MLNPCHPDALCKDTCRAPFYECTWCDEQSNGLYCDKPVGRFLFLAVDTETEKLLYSKNNFRQRRHMMEKL